MSRHPTRPQEVSFQTGTRLPLTRRDLLRRGISAATLAALGGTAPLVPRDASAQSPKRGGTLTLRL